MEGSTVRYAKQIDLDERDIAGRNVCRYYNHHFNTSRQRTSNGPIRKTARESAVPF